VQLTIKQMIRIYTFLCLFLLTSVAFADDYYEKGVQAYGSGQYEEAVDWFRKSAEAGYDDGQYIYGLLYERGQVIEQDYRVATEWYRKAANQGHLDAANNLGKIYDAVAAATTDQAEAKKYYEEAVYWYRQAAEDGLLQAQANLALMYAGGTGIEKDHKKAVEWWQKAANQGDPRSMFNLGAAYANGQGVSKDLMEAYAWMYLANGGTSFDFSGYQVTVDYSAQVAQLEEILDQDSIKQGRARAAEIHAQVMQ
jgi:hypothetical protein